jgi:hypothetical protein
LRALEAPEGEEAPKWIANYELPGTKDARTEVEEAEQDFTKANGRLVEARATLEDASRYQGLLWREGDYSFAPLVRDAFRALGFVVTPEIQNPAEITNDDEIAILEIDASAHTVKESSYFRLQRRIEDEFIRSGVRRKGVIAVNGERQKDPKKREEPLSETLINACENFGYALITGESLFKLVSYALEGADTKTLATIRRTILEAEGLLVIQEDDNLQEDAVDLNREKDSDQVTDHDPLVAATENLPIETGLNTREATKANGSDRIEALAENPIAVTTEDSEST